MNDKQNLVLHGLLELSDPDAQAVINEYERLKKLPRERTQAVQDSIERTVKVYAGPSSGGTGSCPCCNR